MTRTHPHLTQTVLDACHTLAEFTTTPGSITRLFLTPPMHDVHAYLTDWAQRLGMTSHVDAAGNLRCRWEGSAPEAPTLYLGSHLDTVPNAGAYDGILGVVLGFALVEALGGQRLPFALEVLGFSEEEGVRYGASFFGSLALLGTAGPMLDLRDAGGQTVREALTAFGLDAQALPSAEITGEALGYFEIHIEQGPVLEAAGQSVGIVEAIAGQNRFDLTFTGRASHAGTTPMLLRRDALAAAARFVVAAEDLARSTPGLVATVGMMDVKPGAGNVIPGEARCSLDLRHARDEVRLAALPELLASAEGFASERGVTLTVTPKMEVQATPMHPQFRALLHQAAADAGLPHPDLVSGAGHDAMVLAARMPAAMLFVRSPGGLSHHPDEAVLAEDVTDALAVGSRFLQLLAAEGGRHGL
ncbi:allantoate amidohydrolase [Deinococcus sp. Arct2-2]|uniref:allantoate amidohydrolase n=1 Tax=Deinococcus sp. Arct2-2 TaxID=2568653 RepID=UPI0010A2FD47|nr:allantoate amidohydrolase [Deinococcus sp. Arct2-2]THF71609.1 allantoate amidohydrolase [Deinococcus sp. Arct2-2]